jgi:hypothetical protein
MATIEEKTVHTSNTEIRLYKEGAFWVAYEQIEDTLIEKIHAFDLSNSTPVECMLFVAELKKTIHL